MTRLRVSGCVDRKNFTFSFTIQKLRGYCGQYPKVSCQENLHYAHILYLCVCRDSYYYSF